MAPGWVLPDPVHLAVLALAPETCLRDDLADTPEFVGHVAISIVQHHTVESDIKIERREVTLELFGCLTQHSVRRRITEAFEWVMQKQRSLIPPLRQPARDHEQVYITAFPRFAARGRAVQNHAHQVVAEGCQKRVHSLPQIQRGLMAVVHDGRKLYYQPVSSAGESSLVAPGAGSGSAPSRRPARASS